MPEIFPSPETNGRPGRDAIAILVIAIVHCIVFGMLAARSERTLSKAAEHRSLLPSTPLRDPTPVPVRKFQPELIS